MTDYTSREYADAELDHAERMEKKRAEIKAREIVALVDSIGVGTDDLVLYKCNLVTAITQALLEFSQGSTVGDLPVGEDGQVWGDGKWIWPSESKLPESVSDAEIEKAVNEYDREGDPNRRGGFRDGYRAALSKERVK